MRNEKYYYCYSYPQKRYLMDNDERYVIKGIHPVSQKTFWVFERNEKLNELLENWKLKK